MGNIYKDEAGHFTDKENDGGPCRHKRINSGKYEKSEDGGKTWTQFNSRKEYDDYDGEGWEFDSDSDDEESSPMNEFSGPDQEGPSYAQLDAYKGKSIAELDKMGFEGWHNTIVNNLRNSVYDTPEEAHKAVESGKFDDKQKAYLNAYINQVFGEDIKEEKPDATTYEGAEVIGGDDDNEGMLKDKTPLSKEESDKLSLEGAEKDDKEWRLKPENLAIVQKLQKMGLNTGSMSEEDFDIAREFLNRFGK